MNLDKLIKEIPNYNGDIWTWFNTNFKNELIDPTFINYDDIKKRFLTLCEDAGVKNETIVYEIETYSKNPSALINEKINFGDNVYDFLVFYNNPERLRSDNNYDVASIILKASCNVCFMNGGLCKQQNDN